MSAPRDKLAALRHLLAVCLPAATRAPGRTLATGLAAIDDATGGGLPLGDVTEIVRSDPICGSRPLLGQLLAVTHASRTHVG